MGGRWAAAAPAIVLSVILVALAPDLVLNVARGRRSELACALDGLVDDSTRAIEGARSSVGAQLRATELTRMWLNHAPVAEHAPETRVSGPTDFTIRGEDPDDGDRLEVRIERLPRRGTVEILEATVPARVRYSPTAGSTGTDSFAVVVCDGLACSSPVSRRVEIASPMPLASAHATASRASAGPPTVRPIALGAPAEMGQTLTGTQVTVDYLRQQTALLDGRAPDATGGTP